MTNPSHEACPFDAGRVAGSSRWSEITAEKMAEDARWALFNAGCEGIMAQDQRRINSMMKPLEETQMIEKTIFTNVTTEELRMGKKHTVFTIFKLPISAKTEAGKIVTVNAELSVDNKYYATFEFRENGFSIRGETLYNNLLAMTEDRHGRYPTASVNHRDGKTEYVHKNGKFTYDPEAKTLTVENKVDTHPQKLTDYFMSGNVDGVSKFLNALKGIVLDIDGIDGIRDMEDGHYKLHYEKTTFSLDRQVLNVEAKPAKDRWGNIRYTVSLYVVEGEKRIVKDLIKVVLAATGMPLAITVGPQAHYTCPKNPYEATTKVICKKQGKVMNVDYDEAIEALEVLQYRLGRLDHVKPEASERVLFYLKRGNHTQENPVHMGTIIDVLGLKLADARDILGRLMDQGKAEYIPAIKARDDLVYYTPKAEAQA